MNYSAKVIIATHKIYQMPEDDLYLPLHVGAANKVDSKVKSKKRRDGI